MLVKFTTIGNTILITRTLQVSLWLHNYIEIVTVFREIYRTCGSVNAPNVRIKSVPRRQAPNLISCVDEVRGSPSNAVILRDTKLRQLFMYSVRLTEPRGHPLWASTTINRKPHPMDVVELFIMVEPRGIEPLTSSLPAMRSPS